MWIFVFRCLHAEMIVLAYLQNFITKKEEVYITEKEKSLHGKPEMFVTACSWDVIRSFVNLENKIFYEMAGSPVMHIISLCAGAWVPCATNNLQCRELIDERINRTVKYMSWKYLVLNITQQNRYLWLNVLDFITLI